MVSVERDQEGAVTVRLNVDATGVVTRCEVRNHPGIWPSMSRHALYRARARFEPARDGAGKPVAGEHVQRINWKLEGESAAPSPRQAWMMRSTVGLTRQGAVVDCKLESAGTTSQPEECEFVKAMMSKLTGQSANAASPSPIAAFTISETYFYPVPSKQAPEPPALPDATMLAQQISQITIEPDGRISDCKGIRYSGNATTEVDACMFIRHQRFVPAPPGTKAMVGTIVLTAYLRRQSIT